jgi:TatA/E family protein of Tat protein translocase
MLATIVSSDWIWVALVVVVLFGGSQLPKLAKNAGDAMKEFRKAHAEATEGAAAVQAPAPAPLPMPPAVGPAPVGAVPADSVTLTRAELDALLADREAKTRAAAQPPAAQT